MEIVEAVTAHQGTITGLATARVTVGQGKIGETDMKRIILVALVALAALRLPGFNRINAIAQQLAALQGIFPRRYKRDCVQRAKAHLSDLSIQHETKKP